MSWRAKYDHYREPQWNYEVFETTTFALILMDFGDVFKERQKWSMVDEVKCITTRWDYHENFGGKWTNNQH